MLLFEIVTIIFPFRAKEGAETPDKQGQEKIAHNGGCT